MEIKIKQIIMVGAVLIIVLLDTLFLWNAFSPDLDILFKHTRKDDMSTAGDLKELKQAINYLKKRQPFSFGESGEATPSTGETSFETKFKMEILNGTGASGKARDMKDRLSTIETQVEITMGNTKETPSTTIKFKKSIPQTLKATILSTLAKEIPEIAEEEQADEYPFDITLILGSR